MKKGGLSLLALILSCVSVLANVRVLSMGISDYPASSGWNRINAHNDVALMKALFPKAVLLENATATRSEIESQLRFLSCNAAKGDTIIIHFSGHGQQIVTKKSTDEIDGVDEAIVPYDAAKRMSAVYKGEHHFTDDAFGNAVDNIRKAVGSNGLVIALIDACHSDSMDKGTERNGEIYRGADEIFGSETMTETEISIIREAYHNQEEPSLNQAPDLSNVIYLSACKSDKRNYEVVVNGRGYGSLTYYFVEACKEKGLTDLSKFLSAVYDGMKSDPTLQFHGQLPAIRNTIGWVAPPNIIPPVQELSVEPDTSKEILTPAIIIAVALIVIFMTLWLRRKKRK